jgi:hypothetical protein
MANTSKSSALPIISDSDVEKITQAYTILHSVLATYGEEKLPTFDDCGLPEYERLGNRAVRALFRRQAYLKEQALAHLRQAAKAVTEPYVTAKHAEKEQFDAAFASVPGAMRTYIKPFDPTVVIPLSDFSHIFPQGTDLVKQVVALKDMGYTVAKGKDGFYVRFQVVFEINSAQKAA